MRISLYTSFEKKLIALAEKEGIAPSAYIKAFIVNEYENKFTNDPSEVNGVIHEEFERGESNRT